MIAARIRKLTLTNFRSYRAASVGVDADMVVLTGQNGAGKTNVLEAISFLAPGRGLRRATLDEAAFARMKPDAFFINMSRGNLVDETALLKVLKENRIAGAAMDVGRAPDEMPSPELARLANVIATPHIGGLTPPASESQAFDTVRQVEALVKGEVPAGAANLKDWTRHA